MRKIILMSATVLLTFSCSKNQYQSTDELNTLNLDFAAYKSAGLERFILESNDLNSIEQEVKGSNGIVVRSMQAVNGLVVYLPPVAVQKMVQKYSGLKVTKDIEMSAGPDHLNATARPRPSTPPPPQNIPWGITKIQAVEAHSINKGEGVKVCVIDSGIDKTHPDLINNLAGGKNFVVIKGKLNPDNWNDDNGHGSHVAGTIAAEDNSFGALGVAPKAKLYAVKALDSRGSGFMSDVADGVTACVTAGAQVINMSLGASGDPNQDSALKTAILNAQAANVVVVVAAGNEGQDIKNTVPAGYPSVIAVAATDVNNQYPTWSNFGLDANDISAPGVSIYSTWKSGQYNTISGTSMASPHVAGVVALQLSAQSSVLRAIDIGYDSATQGQGLVNALLSVQP